MSNKNAFSRFETPILGTLVYLINIPVSDISSHKWYVILDLLSSFYFIIPSVINLFKYIKLHIIITFIQ